MSSVTGSVGLVLEEFYKDISCVGVSAINGVGMDDLFNKIQEKSKEINK